MGVQIHGPKDSWLRFAVLDVPYEMIPSYVIAEYHKWLDRERECDEWDDPLPLAWGAEAATHLPE